MPKVGVILSGCGYLDGSEITESVITLLALDRAGAEVFCFAPSIEQRQVSNHLTGELTTESRNVLTESARVVRGKISDLSKANANELDALILPGGFGAALNLSSFGIEGASANIHDGLATLLREMHEQKKPIGGICIAPALLALALGDDKPLLTIGDDVTTANELEKLGAQHKDCVVQGAVTDEQKKIVTCPAYMYEAPIKDIASGIETLVEEVIRLCGDS